MRKARLLALPIAAAVVALSAPASIAATPALDTSASALPGSTAQGIIMSEGRICNPRTMLC